VTVYDRDQIAIRELTGVQTANVIDYGTGTLNEAIVAIGATPTSLAFGTDQTLTANLTIPSTIELVRLNGAKINRGAYTISFPDGTNTESWGDQQIFSGTGAITGLKEARPEWFTTNTTPGTTNMATALQAAVNAAPVVKLGFGVEYAKNVAITVPANRTIEGYGATVTNTADNVNGFTVTGSNVTFRGIKIKGVQYAAQTTARAISAEGDDASNYLTNIHVIDCDLTTWGMYGLYMRYVDGFSVTGTTIQNIFYAGIMGLSVQNGNIPASTTIKNVTGSISANAYGISMTRANNDSLVTEPRSKNITISARVDNVPVWNGIGTHGGENITVSGAVVTGCEIGVEGVAASNTAGDSTFAPLNLTIANNVISSGKTDGSAGPGARIAGAGTVVGTPVQLATGSITGNTITGHGDESNANDGAIYLTYTKNVAVTGNPITEAGRNGIALYHDNYGVTVNGNPIVDAWTNAGAIACAVNASSDYNTGSVSGNTFTTGGKSATHVMDYGVRAGTGANNRLRVGNNYSTATSYAIDSSTGRVALSGGPFAESKTWDPPSVANGATTTTTVNVGSAVLGAFTSAAFSLALPTGVYLRSESTTQGVITVTLVNGSGSTQDVASGTLSAQTFR